MVVTISVEGGNDDGDNLTGAFPADYGWKVTPNKRDLAKLISVANFKDPASWYKALDSVVDRPNLLKFMAVETFLGHWDGYTGPNINNYFIRSSTRGKFTFIPWGADQTFGENRQTPNLFDTFNTPLLSKTSTHPWLPTAKPRGSLYVKCISYIPCRNAYLAELKATSAMATKIKLGTLMKSAGSTIKSTLTAQFKNDPDYVSVITKEQSRSISFITARQKEVAALLAKYKIK